MPNANAVREIFLQLREKIPLYAKKFMVWVNVDLKKWAVSFFTKKNLGDLLASLPSRIRAFSKSFVKFLSDFPVDTKLRYKTTLAFIVIIFFSLALLSRSNPYSLLIPTAGYPLPSIDSRDTFSIYAFPKGSDKAIEAQIKMKRKESIPKDIPTLAFQLSVPVDDAGKHPDLERLPFFGNSIRQVWHREKTLYIDLRGETLNDELYRYLRTKEAVDQTKLLDSYFFAFTKTLLSFDPSVQSVQFRVDGKPAKIDSMTFDLSVPHTSANTVELPSLPTLP